MLKGNKTEDADRPESIENVKIFHLQAFHNCSINIYATDIIDCFQSELFMAQACWFTLY